MKYKQKTPHLGIPVVGKGDRISADQEYRKAIIIENMLIAGTQGLTEVVFDDGTYRLNKDGDVYEVTVSAGGTYPSMHGIVGGFYFKGASRVKWDNLKDGYFYYLYVKATSKTPHENSAIRLTASSVKLGKGSLLMATIDLREDTPVIETNPDGKVYSADVARHASDSSNPHGRQLEQEELTITHGLTVLADAEVRIGEKIMSGKEFVEAANNLLGLTTEVIDFETAGSDGIALTASGKVKSVTVHRRGVLSDKQIGETSIGYFGDDDNADKDSEFIFYNSMESGIPMRAVVMCTS
jgi:hypothetical protein